MARRIAVALVVGLVALVGCLDHDNFGLGQNQGNTDDDDFADDDDSAKIPGPWETYQLGVSFAAIGGPEGGDANVLIQQTFFDDAEDYTCGRQLSYRATYTYGTEQDDQIYQWADEVITLDDGEEVGGDCPSDYDISANELMALWEWIVHPLVFVSCDSVAASATLADVPVTLEEFIWQGEWGDGTFDFFCEKIGPAAVYFYHTGPHEGVWLRPGKPGDLDEYAEFNYFQPADDSNVEVWMFYGFSVAEEFNKSEPIEGLEGQYRAVPLWPWIYTRDS